jgi:hypothetical protein
MSPGQLAKEHCYKLVPTGESSGMTLGFSLYEGFLKIAALKE